MGSGMGTLESLQGKLGVVLLNWNDSDQTIKKFLDLQQWSTLKPHLIVVDNASDERDRQRLIGALPQDSLIRNDENLGFAGGNNVGIQHLVSLDYKYILLLNTDASIEESAVITLLSNLQDDTETGVVGPVVCEKRKGREEYLRGGKDPGLYLNTRQTSSGQQNSNGLVDVYYVPGMSFLFQSTLINRVGLLDEAYFFSGEIADFCQRARMAGYKIKVDSRVLAEHDISDDSTARRSSLYLYYNFRNRFLHVKKHHSDKRTSLCRQWTIRAARQYVSFLLSGKWPSARATRLAVYHGLSGIFGNQNRYFL